MRLLLALCLPFWIPADAAASRPQRETVFLVHGMGRTRLSMQVLAWRLRRDGFRVESFPYNHASDSLPAIAGQLKHRVGEHSRGGRYHLVGHSLGNVIIREGFRSGYPAGLGRVVMLAPPNQPARLALRLKKNLLYRWVTGDSGQKLSSTEFFAALPVPSVEFAVLAGDRGNGLVSEEPNDGIILVATTRLAGMRDFVVLNKTHTFLMNSAEAGQMTARFLKDGRLRLVPASF